MQIRPSPGNLLLIHVCVCGSCAEDTSNRRDKLQTILAEAEKKKGIKRLPGWCFTIIISWLLNGRHL